MSNNIIMEEVDKVTLELLMNKNSYNRYIEKEYPHKHKEEQEYRQKIRKYKSRMLNLMEKYLENPDFEINGEMNTMLRDSAKTFIRYFEMNQYEEEENRHEYEEDMMFGKIDDVYESNMDSASVCVNDGMSEKSAKILCKYTMDKYVKRA